MQASNTHQKVGQIFNWFLDCAADGTHSSSGIPKTREYLIGRRGLIDDYIDGEFRRLRFADVTTMDMQDIIDAAVAQQADAAALGIRALFDDVEKFALRQGIIVKPRTKKLVSPCAPRQERVLDDTALTEAWTTLRRHVNGGSIGSRLASIAILVSTMTLQPLPAVFSMRRSELSGSVWIRRSQNAYAHLPTAALDLVGAATEIGDSIHSENGTDLVFPSFGAIGDPNRPASISLAHEVCHKAFGNKIKPQDLRHTGVASLKAMGGESFSDLLDQIAVGLPATPSKQEVAIIEAWCGRLDDLERNLREARWR